MDEYKKHGVYKKVPIKDCWNKTGKKPVGVRWVIVNKGDETSTDYRARLVAKELKIDERLDLFAATPPLEAKKLLFSRAATRRGNRKHLGEYKLSFIDIKRAYFHAPETRDVYVDLTDQDWQEGICGKLEMSMYGTRGAAQNWAIKYETVLVVEMGFVQGKGSPCNFYHHERDIRTVVHGDDFTSLAAGDQCNWLAKELKKHFDLKVRGVLGSGPQNQNTQ
jgi:hypothetical protein